MGAIQDLLIAPDVARPDEIVGLSDAEIEAVRVSHGVDRLPGAYREFLRPMGRSAGYLLTGTSAFCPEMRWR